jgi:hypothetical protein
VVIMTGLAKIRSGRINTLPRFGHGRRGRIEGRRSTLPGFEKGDEIRRFSRGSRHGIGELANLRFHGTGSRASSIVTGGRTRRRHALKSAEEHVAHKGIVL